MNAGYRNLLGRSDTSRFNAYLLAVALQMLILPLLSFFGIIKISAPAFYPAGAILGGFLFGLAMNWGGGCAAGLWYKLGSGNIGALVAVLSLIAGYVTAEVGALKPLRVWVQSIGAGYRSLSIPLWWAGLPIAVALLFFLLKGFSFKTKDWRRTGIAVGFIAVFAWITSSVSRRYFGMAVMPGNKDFFDLLTTSRPAWNWDLFFVLGIPIGGYLSARRFKEFKWTNINGAAIWKIAGGGFLLGIAASIAGGCTVGHGLTGVPLLSPGSIFFTVFAILGAWAGVVFSKRKTESIPKQ
ncbi:YeeE/YedE family protein [bacterium]|nr:YeeE/YedE family protein [bacterium]MCI0613589.1 YeeE/YedE family protein [bacterium]